MWINWSALVWQWKEFQGVSTSNKFLLLLRLFFLLFILLLNYLQMFFFIIGVKIINYQKDLDRLVRGGVECSRRGLRRSKGNCKYILNLLFPLLILLVFIYFSWIAFESKISRKEVTLHILFVEPEINFLNLIINDILESFFFLPLFLPPPPPSFFSPFFILQRNFCYFWLFLFLLFTTSNLTGGCEKERCLESEREILYIQIPLEKLAQKKLHLRP